MSFSWFIARRLYSHGGDKKRLSRSATVIATTGVALGLAIMVVSVSVVLGFKTSVRDKVTGIGSHILFGNYESLYNPERAPIQLKEALLDSLLTLPGVKCVQPFCQKTGMLKTDEDFQGVVFRGVEEHYDLSFLRHSLVDGGIDGPFCKDRSTDRLVISSYLAKQLRLEVGSRVYAYFFEGTLKARRFTIEAIYATNLSEHDRNLVFCDYHTTHQLLGYSADQASGAELLINNFDSLDVVGEEVYNLAKREQQDDYGAYYSSATITEIFPSIFSWLSLLDINVIVILLLMLAVACFTTISGLLILVLEHTQFIGIMKALGATNSSMRRVFIYYSMLIVLRGVVLGALLGIVICLAQAQWGIIHLDPTTYYVDAVPILMNWPLTIGLCVGVLLVSVVVLVLPSHIVSNIQPAKSIRFE